MSVVVVGSVNLDAVARVERLPAAGETVLATSFDWVPGGKGANQAVAASRQGAASALVARVGDDDAGRMLRAGLADEGVDVTHVRVTPGATTGIAQIAVDRAGANSIVVAANANRDLSPDDLDMEVLARAQVVLAQLETPVGVAHRAFELARERGATTVLNPSPATPLAPDLLALADVVVANEHEAACVPSGAVPALVVTMGARGAVLVERGRETSLPSFAVDVVDTTAAGDAFCGALAAVLDAGRSLVEALPTALAAGALAVTRHGAQPSLPTGDEVAALLLTRSP